MDKKKLKEISSNLFFNKCKVHKADRAFPCPYPNCQYGITADSFIVKSTDIVMKLSNNTKYYRKEWKGINGDLKHKWNKSKNSYSSIRNMVYDATIQKSI